MKRIKTSNYLLLALVAAIFVVIIWQAHTAHTYIKDIRFKNTPTTVEAFEKALSSGLKSYQAFPMQPFNTIELENVDVAFIKGNHYGVYVDYKVRRSIELSVTDGKLRISNTNSGFDPQNEIFVTSPQMTDIHIKGIPGYYRHFEIAGFENVTPNIIVESGTAVVRTTLTDMHFLLRQGGGLSLYESIRFPLLEAAPHLTLQLEDAGAITLRGKQKLAGLTIQGNLGEVERDIRMSSGSITTTYLGTKSRIEGFPSCDSLHIDIAGPSDGLCSLTLPKSWEGLEQHIKTDGNVKILWAEGKENQ